MYVSAQRVVNPSTRRRGVNLYLYRHGSYTWTRVPAEFLPDKNPGELMWQQLQLPPPGNRVLSYLDVVAPDEMPFEDLRNRVALLKATLREAGNPTVASWDPLWVRFGLGYLALPWSTELGALAGHLVLELPGAW